MQNDFCKNIDQSICQNIDKVRACCPQQQMNPSQPMMPNQSMDSQQPMQMDRQQMDRQIDQRVDQQLGYDMGFPMQYQMQGPPTGFGYPMRGPIGLGYYPPRFW
jgi:hypothetical protein